MIALKQFVRHAQLFGTECVYETASGYLDSSDLVRLRIELDAIEAGRKSASGYSVGKRRRRSVEETKAAVLALRADGLIPATIADKLGLKDKYVRELLAAA